MSEDRRADETDPEDSPLPTEEQALVEEAMPFRSPVVYEIVRLEGETELARPLASLWWSAVAGGLGIFPSLVAMGAMRAALPDAPWRSLVEGFGYSIGFVIVIVGRLQFFTENTITAVLPLFANWSRTNVTHTLRLWGVVFAGNLLGTTLTSLLAVEVGLVPESVLQGIVEISLHFVHLSPAETFVLAIPAGFLVASIVWMTPNAEGAEVAVIVLMTWTIAVGGFAHVVVGSAELATLFFAGEIGAGAVVSHLLPALLGNIAGGTGLFALLAYAQVRTEM